MLGIFISKVRYMISYTWPLWSSVPNNKNRWIGWGCGVQRVCRVYQHGWSHPWFGMGAHGTIVGVGWLHPIGHRWQGSWSQRGTSLCAGSHTCADSQDHLCLCLQGHVVQSFFSTPRQSQSNCRARTDWVQRSMMVQTSQARFPWDRTMQMWL